jgi:hypothetical protein
MAIIIKDLERSCRVLSEIGLIIPAFSVMDASTRVTGDPGEIRTDHYPNALQERFL